MSRLTIEIGEVILQTEAERSRLDGAASTVQQAFLLLGERLDRTPFGRRDEARAFALEQLQLSVVSLDELLSNRGAELLAEELYRQILRRVE